MDSAEGAHELRSVFFDLYGTLLVYGDMSAAWSDWLEILSACLAESGLDLATKHLAGRCEGFFRRPEPVDDGTEHTIYERRVQRLFRELGCEPLPRLVRTAAARTAAAWQRHVRVDPEAVPILTAIGARSPLALVSNFDHPPHVRRVLDDTGLGRFFDAIVISAEVGVKKPDPGIFASPLEQLGLAPQEVAYVGDVADDVRAATAAGMQPILLQRPGGGSPGTDFGAAAEAGLAEAPAELVVIRSLTDIVGLMGSGDRG